MNLPDSSEDIEPHKTVHVSNVGELYDFVIGEMLEYDEEDINRFDVYDLEYNSKDIRVRLFGPPSVLEKRLDELYDRTKEVGKEQTTLESATIDYTIEEQAESNQVLAVARTRVKPIQFIIE